MFTAKRDFLAFTKSDESKVTFNKNAQKFTNSRKRGLNFGKRLNKLNEFNTNLTVALRTTSMTWEVIFRASFLLMKIFKIIFHDDVKLVFFNLETSGLKKSAEI